MAMDIATCDSEESKLEWAFKLYDIDNSGCLELNEMVKNQPLGAFFAKHASQFPTLIGCCNRDLGKHRGKERTENNL